ncbi:MAG: hypothetical protein Q8P88_00895 [Candidatus Jorgensenbacteria bacterium]|nr:hypothetical protein [Candidatus Jorgensenbacteria bacterium]
MKTTHAVETDVGMNISTETVQRSRLDSVALGFLVLAARASFFMEWLAQRLRDRALILPGVIEVPAFEHEPVEWVPPINPAVAEQKLTWLLNEMEYAPERQRQRIINILNLAHRNPVPQAAAWGFIFNETLGVFVAGHPFNFNTLVDYSQAVIVGPGWHLLAPHDLTRKVSRVSLMALSKCIEDAGFKLDRLEPEVGSWLLEGSGVRLYDAENGQSFKDVLACVRESGLPFASISEEVDMLALQPCITGSYETLLAELTPLE